MNMRRGFISRKFFSPGDFFYQDLLSGNFFSAIFSLNTDITGVFFTTFHFQKRSDQRIIEK